MLQIVVCIFWEYNQVFYSFWNGQCIASTTVDEHRTHFEKDKALARRFQPVFINEPSEVMLEFFLL